MFLTRAELEELTGRKQAAAQRRWLMDNGYKFDVRADGRPAVLLEQVQLRQIDRGRSRRVSGPNLDALDQLG